MSLDNNNNIRNKTQRCQNICGTITALNMKTIKKIQSKFCKDLTIPVLLERAK
jgi:hypothetical protein